jgi:hypothetical protein
MQDFTFLFDRPTDLSATVGLRVAGARSSAGRWLDPVSFASPTNPGGSFEVTLRQADFRPCPFDGGCWEWLPSIR